MNIPKEKIELIPDDKLTSWNTKYLHLLARDVSKDETAFLDLINAANFAEFSEYIHDETNIYGQSNAATKVEFEKYGIDYKTWINPSKDSEIQFVAKNKDEEQLSQITAQINEDINALRKTPIKGLINKRFKNFIQNDKFIIPQEICTNKTKLEIFIKNIIEQLDDVWKRAQGNLDNPDKATSAKNTLTILDHLNQRLSDIIAIDTSSGKTKTLDLTIKMWDRIPQKDIFQGNYSTCCIGMGNQNSAAMPYYLLNTAYNMIEIVDNYSGSVMGNALCYFVTDENDSPIFIVDNVEISNSYKTTEKVGIELRDNITEYASRIAKQVSGRDDFPIYMSTSYNDAPTDDLKEETKSLKLLGHVDCDSIYMDLYGGWEKPEGVQKVQTYRLK